MKKSNEFLNKSVTRKDLFSNYSIFTLILLFIYAIGFFTTTLGPAINGHHFVLDLSDMLKRMDEQYHFSATEAELYFATIIPFVVFMLQFSFLHKKSSCYTTLSFNINRKNLYRNRLLFPLLFILIVMIATKLFVLKMNIDAFGFKPLLFEAFFSHLFIYMKIVLFTIFCAVFASVLCGRTIEAAAAGISIFALPSVISIYVNFINSFTLYGATEYSETIFTKIANALNPLDWSDAYYLYPDYDEWFYEFYTPPIQSITISVAWIILLCLGLFAMGKYFEKCYKPEKSGFKGVNIITSSLISITLPLFVTLYFYEDLVYSVGVVAVSTSVLLKHFILSAVVLIACSFICNFLVHFTFRKVRFAITGVIVIIIFMSALAGINSTDIFNTYNKIPDKDDVVEINMEVTYDGLVNAGEATGNVFFGMLDRKYDYTAVDTEKEIELAMDLHKAIVDNRDRDTTLHASFTYTLKDGTEKKWEYSFLSEEAVIEAMKLRESEVGEEYLRELLLPDTIIDEETGRNHVIDYQNSSMIISPIPGSTFYPDLNKLSAQEFRLLREVILKDVMSISNDDWFSPTEKTLAYIILNVRTVGDYWYEDTPFMTPVYPSMKNTLDVLKQLDFHGDISYETPIKEVYIADLADIVDFITDSSVNGPIFSSLYSISFDMNSAPVTKVENKSEWDALFKKAYPYYYVGSEKQGKVLIVKFANSQPTPMALYYIP